MSALLPICDGYNFTGATEARGRCPRIRFEYRPALPEEVEAFRMAPRASPAEVVAAKVKLLKSHLKSWDVTEARPDGTEETVAITPETLKRLRPWTMDALVDFVCGYAESEAEADAKN